MITEAREELVTLLTGAGLKAYEPWPDRIDTPCAIVGIEDPYLTPGQFGKAVEVFLSVTLMVGRSSTNLADLEALIETAWEAVDDWAIKQVDAPVTFDYNGGTYLGTVLHLSKQCQ